VPQIEVRFDIDANGILNVTAVEKGTGKTNQITITNDKGRLTKAEIEHMLSEASRFEAEDKQQRERIEARHALENYAYSTKTSLDDMQGLSAADKEKLLEAIERETQWASSNEQASKDEFDHHRSELEAVCAPILRNAYAARADPSTGVPKGGARANASGAVVEEVS
jgi:L1 cell adhesion molecule like protein